MPAPPPPPSRADKINDFANGFFKECDKDGDAYLTKDEMKKCLKSLMKQSKQGMKDSLKQ